MSEQIYPVRRGQDIELKIEKLSFGGAGLSRLDNYVIFVKNTVPGDHVKARVVKRKTSFAEAVLLEIVQPSHLRQNAPCPYFNWCGGCTWQNLSYKKQLEYKQQIVRESLEHLGGLGELSVQPVMGSDIYFGYRNKMEFSFSDRRWLLPQELNAEGLSRNFALGLHIPGTFDKILHIDRCFLQSEIANQILSFVSKYAQEHNLLPYGIRSHEGFLRFLVIRQSEFTGKLMVNMVTNYENTEQLQPLANEIVARFKEVAGVVNNINTRPAQIAVGEWEVCLAGVNFIQEKLGDFIFNISANSFFQTNTRQAGRLYQKVMEFAALSGDEVVWDLYAGTGTISLFLAQTAREVIGFELAESAVRDAEKNADEHGVTNTRFIGGDLLERLLHTEPKPDVLVTDPPRSGMNEKVVRVINELQPGRIVYVSCNPTTLARDLVIMQNFYDIEIVQPVDMFPQTYHIETVVKLRRKQ